MAHIASIQDLYLERWLRKREAGEIIWTTKNGDNIPIKNLGDSHLNNIINMLENQEELSIEEWELRGLTLEDIC